MHKDLRGISEHFILRESIGKLLALKVISAILLDRREMYKSS